MTDQMTPFAFDDQLVRTHVDENGDPWFVAKDVCKILEIQNPSDTVRKILDEDERGVATIYTLGGEQKLLTISESGLYSLVFRSRKPQAKVFSKWVRSEVLPTLRKTGTYSMPYVEEPQENLEDQARESMTYAVSDLLNNNPRRFEEYRNMGQLLAKHAQIDDKETICDIVLCLCKHFYTDESLDAHDGNVSLSPDELYAVWNLTERIRYLDSQKRKVCDFFVVAHFIQEAKAKLAKKQELEGNFTKRTCGVGKAQGCRCGKAYSH